MNVLDLKLQNYLLQAKEHGRAFPKNISGQTIPELFQIETKYRAEMIEVFKAFEGYTLSRCVTAAVIC